MSAPTIEDILAHRIPDGGLTEEGISLLRRLHAAGSPITGRDAWLFAGMMREVSADLRPIIYDYLGYHDIDSYPLMRRKGETTLDRSLPRSARTAPYPETEAAQPDAPSTKRVRRRSAKVVDADEGTTERGGRITRDGKPDRRCESRTNNPAGKEKMTLPWERLEPNKWYRTTKAAAIMEANPRTVRRRVAKKEVPDDIRISGIPNLCYFVMRVAID